MIEVSQLIQWFEDAEEATADARKASERDRDYFDGIQWTAAEKAKLDKRNQPIITVNRVKRQINFLKGVEAQSRTDPKGLPRTPEHEGAADAATDAIRFVADNNSYDTIRSQIWEHQMVEGTGAVEITVKPKGDEFEIVLSGIPWDRYFVDPHSALKDHSDARFNGVVVWMDFEPAKDKFPGKEDILTHTLSTDPGDTYDDRPKHNVWADKTRKRVRVVQINYLDGGVWHSAVITKGGALEDPKPSPYVDEDGNPENPLLAQSAYVDRDNNRYGVVRDMISPQDEINHRRSKALHLINVRQARIGGGLEDRQREVRDQLARADGVVLAEEDEFEILPTTDMAVGNLNMLQEAKNEIDLMGPNVALQGKQQESLSGRALLATQQGGMVELAPLLDGKRQLDLRVYRAIWNRVRQFWTAEKWVRVTDDENNLKFVGLNQPVTVAERLSEATEDQRAFIMQNMGLTPDDPRLNQVIEVQNEVAEMLIDIVIEEGPDLPTIQMEQFEQLARLAQSGVPIPPDALVEASSIRNKDRIIEKMQGGGDENPEAARAAAEEAQRLKQIQFDGLEVEVAKTRSETIENIAQAAKANTEAQSA